MTKTPISDFLKEYQKKEAVRLHMPGHKGVGSMSEELDITEIDGADSLFEADGIIRSSETVAGDIFGADTYYSTEGSSLSIRAMLYLVYLYAKRCKRRPLIAAGRNAHKSFTSAAALIGFDVDFISPKEASYLSCRFERADIISYFEKAIELPFAVYLTSPDYLGFISDIQAISEECHKRGVLLIVDNAHGAYLKFLSPSRHPIDLFADMCCDSAHKTLSALTGCAYLHISKNAPPFFKERAKEAMMLFASTSPSYLLLNSLDRLNPYLADGYRESLRNFTSKIASLKSDLISHGYSFTGDEPMKLTLLCKEYGYRGYEVARHLSLYGIFSEFSDPDYLVLMPSPENTESELARLRDALFSLPKKDKIYDSVPKIQIPKASLSIRDAVMSDSETLPVSECLGRIASTVTLGCPPAIPIAIPGEMIDENTLKCFEYYGIKSCSVVKE